MCKIIAVSLLLISGLCAAEFDESKDYSSDDVSKISQQVFEAKKLLYEAKKKSARSEAQVLRNKSAKRFMEQLKSLKAAVDKLNKER